MDSIDLELYNLWIDVLNCAKQKIEYNNDYLYGLTQIDDEINIMIGSGQFNKKGEEIMIRKYLDLSEKISKLKQELKKYYKTQIRDKLYLYELLK